MIAAACAGSWRSWFPPRRPDVRRHRSLFSALSR